MHIDNEIESLLSKALSAPEFVKGRKIGPFYLRGVLSQFGGELLLCGPDIDGNKRTILLNTSLARTLAEQLATSLGLKVSELRDGAPEEAAHGQAPSV